MEKVVWVHADGLRAVKNRREVWTERPRAERLNVDGWHWRHRQASVHVNQVKKMGSCFLITSSISTWLNWPSRESEPSILWTKEAGSTMNPVKSKTPNLSLKSSRRISSCPREPWLLNHHWRLADWCEITPMSQGCICMKGFGLPLNETRANARFQKNERIWFVHLHI
jgi:hypothetical protein